MLNLKSKTKNINWLQTKQQLPKVNQLKNKIIIVSTLIIAILFIVIIFFTRTALEISQNKNMDNVTETIISTFNSTEKPDINKALEAVPYAIRFFVVFDNDDGVRTWQSGAANVTESKILNFYNTVKNKTTGIVDSYRFRIKQVNDVKIAVFVDMSKELQTRQDAVVILMLILVGSLVLLLIIISISSRFVIRPFVESYEQQKQFITDASHDLKTPLTIIMSNAEVLEYSSGKNQWTETIKKETKKMSELIDDMLTLSKVESFTEKQERTSVDIAAILNDMIDELDLLWKERNINIVRHIPSKVLLNCNAKQITRLFSVITQNATKYCKEGGKFEVSMRQQKNKVLVSMYNDADLDNHIDYNKLFERFYRSDISRNSSTGGHGIGLSIAKKICELEKYTISASRKNKGIVFNIVLS